MADHGDVLRAPGAAGAGALTLARRALLAIAALTVASGATQLVAPRLVLRVVGGDVGNASAAHFFGIVGMFMVLFGGLLWQALRAPVSMPVPVFWAALQKLGASAAVALGVSRGLFSPLALGVAGFDLLSGVVALWYWNAVRR
ncbi:patatin domain-containing protein [Gemmatirosa kalamazoonensis]|uniref:Patatin domain-containing protein n=1 Tax=Gemmatirosa kalamazoonensis TaxID=861299 RepID=W0RM43_9BACT|nr:hypothetical protein [Gemmatirosa kalamazoonensis]AHG91821.1 patatin domain-containing protein [Gemmatirosa kalamazoonensis]